MTPTRAAIVSAMATQFVVSMAYLAVRRGGPSAVSLMCLVLGVVCTTVGLVLLLTVKR